MAQFGDDCRISQMLLDVACEMDAEADAMEAGRPNEKRLSPRFCPCESYRALLQVMGENTIARPVQVIDLSSGGAKLRCECSHASGTSVVLEIPCCGLRLFGTIARMAGIEAAMVFTPEASADPALRRLLRTLPTAAVATMITARPQSSGQPGAETAGP